jgi:large subunit ribosomal protein L19e
MSLVSQKRLAAEVLKVGTTRIWVDPEDTDRVSSAITRGEIKRLIHQGSIKKLPKIGISRGRKRVRKEELRAGRHRGPGSIKGSKAGQSKRSWVVRIRSIREGLRTLRDKRLITTQVYRKLILMAKGGTFRSAAHLDEYVDTHKLARRR